MYTDPNGEWATWREFCKDVEKFFVNIIEAFISSFEVEVGGGIGLGISINDDVSAEISRDTFIGIDDGKIITGNAITSQLSFLELGIGGRFKHISEVGGQRVTSSTSPWDGPLHMIFYPDTKFEYATSIDNKTVHSNSNDLKIEFSSSVHFGIGGYVSIGFNVMDLVRRLFD